MARSRDVEKSYSDAEIIQKLERLIECMKDGKPYEISVAGERIYIPASASFSIEHEREGKNEELEFQLKWTKEK